MSDLFIFAGEMSGDLHGEKLMKALYAQNPNLKIEGVGGPKMRAVGIDSFMQMEDFQVMGFLDILSSLPKLYKQFQKIKNHLLKSPPKAVIFIDYPGFNLRMARALKRKHSPAKRIQYVCPTVWAWGKKRIPLMEKSLDKLLTLLPFEPDIFTKRRLDATYVGHPLIKRIESHDYDQNWRTFYNIPKKAALISVFPGSREKELHRNFPTQIQVIEKLLRGSEEFALAISCSEKCFLPFLKAHTPKYAYIVDAKHSYEQMRDSHLAIATSGTVTLELALHGVPTVVTFAIRPLDVFIARDLLHIRLPHYALPNIIGQGEIFPELFGPNFTQETLEAKLREFLVSQVKRDRCSEACLNLKNLLGTQDASKTAAKSILELLQ